MLTKKQAQRLNGLISRLDQCAKAFPLAGCQPPGDAEPIRQDYRDAKQALTEYVRSLTQKECSK